IRIECLARHSIRISSGVSVNHSLPPRSISRARHSIRISSGTSRDFIHYDEEPPEDIRIECLARLIDRGGKEWFTLTPVEGMAWIFDQLYEPGVLGTNKHISVIEVGMEENPHLDSEEVEEFLSKLSAEDRKVRGQGKFVVRGGLVYSEFSVAKHVIEPINPRDYMSPEYAWYMSL